MNFMQIWLYIVLPLLAIIGGMIVYYNIELYHVKQALIKADEGLDIHRKLIQAIIDEEDIVKNAYKNLSKTFMNMSTLLTEGIDEVLNEVKTLNEKSNSKYF